MAMESNSAGGGKVFYDPLYSPRRLQNDNSNGQCRKLFDDFSVANHVHFLRPHLNSVSSKSVLQSQDNKLQAKEEKLNK
ncbi:hypothetical protein SUGI_0579560 [Cryptomeria japonica]|nr:hypothetical protein SUGI_0579560 [Cryptomeria japonica]